MKKTELAILERAFAAEINAALSNGIHLIQSRSKAARKLCDDGLLRESTINMGDGLGRFSVTGYELTELGRIAYCTAC